MTDPNQAAQIMRALLARKAAATAPPNDPYARMDTYGDDGNVNGQMLGSRMATDDDLRPDAIAQRTAVAKLKQIQAETALLEQKQQLGDPTQQRYRSAMDANYETGLINNGSLQAPDARAAQLKGDEQFAKSRASNRAQVELEGDPTHRDFTELVGSLQTQRAIAPIAAKAQLQGERPLSAFGERQMANYEDTADIAQQLVDMIDKYEPAAADFRNQHGMLSQVPIVGNAMWKSYLYSHGFTDAEDDARWLAGMLQAKGLQASSGGRMSQYLAKILQEHLTSPNYSLGRNREAAVNLLNQSRDSQENLMGAHRGTLPAMQRQQPAGGMFSRGIK